MLDWQPYLKMTYDVATQSPDESTQNGALLVSDTGVIHPELFGFNRFPTGVVYTPERWVRPTKYKFVEHAERVTILAHARAGVPTLGLTMVCAWAACTDCARAIIEAGIVRLVTHKQAADRAPKFWADEVAVAFTMLREADVEILLWDGQVGGPEVLHSGVRWTP